MAKKKSQKTESSAVEQSTIPLRRFEYKDDKSYKFWSIELNDNSHTVTYGRIGTKGQTSKKDFADSNKAKTSYEKLIAQKVKKGYLEVIKTPVSKKSAAEVRRERKLHEPFEKAIIDNPNDLGNYAVYSDWLTERGDPRGEFMQIQLALEDEKQSLRHRTDLKKKEKSLLARHCRTWLGELTPFLVDQKIDEHVPEYYTFDQSKKFFKFGFARGLLDSIHMSCHSHDFAVVLRESHHCRLLRELVIENTAYVESGTVVHGRKFGEYESTGIFTLLGSKFDNLRHFRLGYDDQRSCHTNGEDAVELIRGMPRLETLHLEARGVDTSALFKLRMPHLRSLTVHHLHNYPLELLAKNSSLKNLETLCIFPHGLEPDDADAYLRLEHLQAIARSKHLKNLHYLQLKASDIGDAGVEELIKSGMLARLNILDLTYGCITDRGAELLAEAPEAKELEKLILNGNGLTPAGVKMLKKAGVKLEAKEQMTIVEDDDEREYLWYGDPE